MFSVQKTAMDIDFFYEEVQREKHALRKQGKRPVRIRISTLQYRDLLASADAATSATLITADGQPKFCGLLIAEDPKWDGPMVVEAAGEAQDRY